MLIGITGTDGSGKGAVVEYLVSQKGFVHYSSRALITEEIITRGLTVNRECMRLVANKMRKEQGHDVIVQKALQQIRESGVKDAVIESIRAVAEVETLRANGGLLLAIDAPQDVRYQRIIKRKSASDKVSFAEFVAHEELEMNDPDPNGMQKAKVISMADYTIKNAGSIEELRVLIDSFLKNNL